MVTHTISPFVAFAASLVGRAAEGVLGIALMALGLAVSITVYLMPIGVFLGVLGLILLLCAREGARLARAHFLGRNRPLSLGGPSAASLPWNHPKAA